MSDESKYTARQKRIDSKLKVFFSRETWPKLLAAAMPFWMNYRKAGDPAIIEGLSVRFISQIPLKENEKLTNDVVPTLG